MPTAVFGRQYIRNDDKSKLVRLWDRETASGTLLDQLKFAYLTGLSAVDARDAYRAEEIKRDRLKPEGLIEGSRITPSLPLRSSSEPVTWWPKLATGLPNLRLRRVCRHRISQRRRAGCGTGCGDRSIAFQKAPAATAPSSLSPRRTLLLRMRSKELAGVSASTYEEITSKLIETVHGPKLQEMEELREGISIALSTIEAADEDLRNEVGVHDPRQWAELTEHVKPEVYIAWLKKMSGKVHVLPREAMESGKGGGAPLASEEDLATGRFFESREDWARANAISIQPI